MIQYYYTKKEWGVVMEKEELKILEELRRILNSKNEAIVILNNYFTFVLVSFFFLKCSAKVKVHSG